MDSKQQAQARVDQIEQFNLELEQLEQQGIVTLSDVDKHKVDEYHRQLIHSLKSSFDIDATAVAKQFSKGMKVASFFGAMAFAASLFFLFYHFWGDFTTYTQTAILVSAPLVGLVLTWLLQQKEQSGYLAKIMGSLSVVCFVLNLSMLGQIYNIAPTPNAFLPWALFSAGLAYFTHSRLLLAFAIMFLTGYLSAKMGTWLGIYWISFGERPENFFLPAILLFAFGHKPQHKYHGFDVLLRVAAALIMLLPVLVLSHWGYGSYLNFSVDTIESVYQVTGFWLSGMLVLYGIKRGWQELVNTGVVFFTLFLYTKLYDWWWEWFPKYLFFLVIALISVLMLLVFKRLRLTMDKAHNHG